MNPAPTPVKGPIMTLFYIAVYHNTDSRFFPYEPGHALTKVISHRRDLPADTSPETIADWAFTYSTPTSTPCSPAAATPTAANWTSCSPAPTGC